MNHRTVTITALALAGLAAGAAHAQTLAPAFASSYSIVDLGGPADVPGPLGGLTFLDADTLLIGGAANTGGGVLRTIDVARAANGQITGFVGTSAPFSTAPNIDGGLDRAPNGTLLFTGYSNHTLGQIPIGATAPTKIIDLNADPIGSAIASSVGTLRFVPAGFAGAGQLKIASYNASTWHTVGVVADPTGGTYSLASVSPAIQLSGGPEGVVYIDGSNAGFGGADSVLVSEYSAGEIGAYQIDANGDPIPSTRQDFVTGLSGAEGAVIDPVTGDFLFSTFGGGNRVIVVTGFVDVPEPGAALALAAAGVVALRRRR